MMLPSRKMAAIFACVFILGALAGGLLSMNLADLRFYNFLNRTNDPASLAARVDQRLAHDYQLDAAEKARIAPLTREMAQNLYGLRRKFAADVLATLDDSHQKIGREMTAEQRNAYQKANEERRERATRMLMPAVAPAGTTSHN